MPWQATVFQSDASDAPSWSGGAARGDLRAMNVLVEALISLVSLVTRLAVFLAIVAFGGFGSAWVMVHSGSALSTVVEGPWVTWPQSGRSDADPYTRAHTASLGLLPLNSSMSLTYHARNDEAGARIHSSCDYEVDFEPIDAVWWSLTVFDDGGSPIPNAAERYAFNTATVTRDADGGATIVLARDARPGNWLPTRGAGNLTLAFTVQDPRWTSQSLDRPHQAKGLPAIRKVNCAG